MWQRVSRITDRHMFRGAPVSIVAKLGVLLFSGFIHCYRQLPRAFLTIPKYPNSFRHKVTTTLQPFNMQMTTSSSNACRISSDAGIATEIDHAIFTTDITLIALNIPAAMTSTFLQKLKDHTFQRKSFKRVHDVPGHPDRRLLLLGEQYKDIQLHSLPPDLREYLSTTDYRAEEFSLQLTYKHFNVDEVLTRILPEGTEEIPSSFEQAGHIAHLNLRDNMLPYKHLIGQAICDKCAHIKTVVNKVGNIETEFRTFPMEVIAGEENFNVTLRESDAKFVFDFRDVYWNSRLQMEHSRLIGVIQDAAKARLQNAKIVGKTGLVDKRAAKDSHTCHQPRLIVADMMAGVGPFAVPLAMKNITTFANDLNPASYKYLVENSRSNKCERSLKCFNMCGRDFILSLADNGVAFDEVIMNLPQNASDFLDVFVGIGKRFDESNSETTSGREGFRLPRINVYGFSTHTHPIRDLAHRAAMTMQCDPQLLEMDLADCEKMLPVTKRMKHCATEAADEDNGCNGADGDRNACMRVGVSGGSGKGHIVRDVSPHKVMVCLSFYLPKEVAYGEPIIKGYSERYPGALNEDAFKFPAAASSFLGKRPRNKG